MNTADTTDRPSNDPSSKNAMDATMPDVSERIQGVHVDDPTDDTKGRITFELVDGRVVSIPLSWSWRLQEATPEERQNFEISPSGYGVHWPDVDEDLSARGVLRGTPAPRPGTAPSPHTPGDWSAPRIKALRNRLGLSQAAFAKRMGARQATVSDWETGKQEPSRMACRLLDWIVGATDGAHEQVAA